MQKCDVNKVEVTLLHECSPVTFFEKQFCVTTSVFMEVNTMDASRYLPVQS